MAHPDVYIALDTPSHDAAARMAAAVRGHAGLKLGSTFFTAHGPGGVRTVAADTPLFLDLKVHDIPATVAGAVDAAAALQPRFLTVHASGGREMLRAAVEAAAAHDPAPGILAVTVLTSLDDATLASVGQATPALDQTRRLATLAADAGVTGLVCSPVELPAVRAEVGSGMTLVVPGIRPAGSAAGDQRRTASPAETRANGADVLVVGRPVTRATDPGAAARELAGHAA